MQVLRKKNSNSFYEWTYQVVAPLQLTNQSVLFDCWLDFASFQLLHGHCPRDVKGHQCILLCDALHLHASACIYGETNVCYSLPLLLKK